MIWCVTGHYVIMNLQALLLCFFFKVFFAEGILTLSVVDPVESVLNKEANLECKIKDTDKALKQVVWYRLLKNSPKKIVYYYEPPKFNGSSPEYKNRVRLASDRSSLVFLAVAKEDEGRYECLVEVATNGSIVPNEIPEESNQQINLIVHVPPSGISINHLTSKQNMTLTCSSPGASPPPLISWIVQRKDETKEFKSAKVPRHQRTNIKVSNFCLVDETTEMRNVLSCSIYARYISDNTIKEVITEYRGNLADTVGYFYMLLSHNEKGTVVYCIVEHPDTGIVLRKNVTMVAPSLAHSVPMQFDWLGGTVPYTTFDSSSVVDDSTPSRNGLVTMMVSPSSIVSINTTVFLSATSHQAFPEPTYTWWSEDNNLGTGRSIRIAHVRTNQEVFCLIENPVGRVLISVQLTVSGSDSMDPVTKPLPYSSGGTVSGAIVGAIAFGSLVFLLIIAFLIYYCRYKPSNKKSSQPDGEEGGDFDSYMVKKKPSTTNLPMGQVGVSPTPHTPVEKQSLLKNPSDISDSFNDSYSPKNNQKDFVNNSTSTSGYGGDHGVSNGAEEQKRGSSKRAISQHLQDFDENASFVGDYGSTFALDHNTPDVSALRHSLSEESSSSDDDVSSHTRSSELEGHYSVPPRDDGSFEGVDVHQVVEPHKRPTDI